MRRLVLLPLLFAAVTLDAQTSRYDQYGPTVEVTIGDLVRTPAAYTGRAVRTRGYLELDSAMTGTTTGRSYRLRDSYSYAIPVVPVPELAQDFESESATYLGREMEIIGLFEETSADVTTPMTQAKGVISFWKFIIVPDRN